MHNPPGLDTTWRAAVWASHLRPSQKIVALAFADHARDDGTVSVSLPRLAEQASLARSTVQECVTALRADGWLVQESPARQTRPPVYSLVVPERPR